MVLSLKDLFQAQDDWDTEYLLSTYHDEFMFIDDYVLMNREEAIDHLLNGVPLENNIWDNERVAVAETDSDNFEKSPLVIISPIKQNNIKPVILIEDENLLYALPL